MQIWLDTDADATTGNQAGFDYIVILEKAGAFLKRATPVGPQDTPQTTLTGSVGGAGASVNRSELGNTAKFNFFVRAIAKSDLSVDDAPDAQDRVFAYSLTAPRPAQAVVNFNPKAPKAGARLLVTVALVKLEDGSSIIPLALPIACAAMLNGKAIRATAIPMACVWKLPRSAKGKRLVVTITVDNHGSKKTFGPWKFRVR